MLETAPDQGVIRCPGAVSKTWKLRNVGNCTWTTDYSLVFSTGDQMGATTSINLPTSVAPRQSIDLSVDLTAPGSPGNYRGYWLLKNAAGKFFGIGVQWNTLANKPFWLAINVTGTPPPTTANGYDFIAHVCEAQWTSGVGVLPCPDQSVSNGTIITVNNPILENNTVASSSALLTVPQNAYNGYIQGVFPPFTVQNGDRFRSIVNCEYGQRNCYVVYRLDYQVNNGPVQNFWAFGERYEGLYYQADVDLSPLAGQTVKFILRTEANGSPTGDRALWVGPSIVRSGGSNPSVTAFSETPTFTSTPLPISVSTSTPISVPTQTYTPVPFEPTATQQPSPIVPTATFTPVPANVYLNSKYGFKFMLPSNTSLAVLSDNRAHVTLPITSGTNLVEKYLDVVVIDGLSPCHTTSFSTSATSSTNTTINGSAFLVETGTDAALGHVYAWMAYSTSYNNACISLNFVLHSADNGAPPYDVMPEASVFDAIMATFGLTGP